MTTILVIEDEAPVRQRIITLLEKAGYTAVPAEDGLSGVDLARKLAPALILCDITLPRLNGIAVLCVLRDELAELGSRLVMMTAVEEPSSQRLVMRLGAHGYVSKPLAANALLAAVRRQLPGKPASPQAAASLSLAI